MTDAIEALDLALSADDGHQWRLLARVPAAATASLLWLPALGVAAKHYLPYAEALAARSVAVFVHEWRGNGSSNLRPGRRQNWGYRELLLRDLPVSAAAAAERLPHTERILGGHSLGGQLACCRLGLLAQAGATDAPTQLWLVASGAPYWRAFPPRSRWWLPFAYRLLPWLAERRGALPGRRIGFGGDEARGLIRDWSRSALSGRYAAVGLDADLEAAMAQVQVQAHSVVLDDDWLAPESSLRYLLSKLPQAQARIDTLGARDLGVRADHFAWLKQPQAVVAALLAR
ncbi:alpha/beta hydrolase family protein [Lysobacter silvisoli]|uniref:Alpha/beta fold hydrolase n=1 Tax=Lysobacter silvisoli TaxID=2293254 RepID=A0A371K4M7_9GAMM|nr:alpha/beta hydrolase [Lysobacter silvisoli]RDZ28876.1 alpha/beta fold hydrolase [Lysobacter silvisoli]